MQSRQLAMSASLMTTVWWSLPLPPLPLLDHAVRGILCHQHARNCLMHRLMRKPLWQRHRRLQLRLHNGVPNALYSPRSETSGVTQHLIQLLQVPVLHHQPRNRRGGVTLRRRCHRAQSCRPCPCICASMWL
jgi:hypothetical protein